MAIVADTDDDRRLGGACLDHVAARATDFRVHILRMNVSFHSKRPENVSSVPGMTSVNFSGKRFYRRTQSSVWLSLAMTVRSSRVVVSPLISPPEAICLSRRRMILPE